MTNFTKDVNHNRGVPRIFLWGGPKFLFYLFSSYNYSLIHYQHITCNNYNIVNSYNSYTHTHSTYTERFITIGRYYNFKSIFIW